ncbi:MAG: tetratricopeptide repeat protein [Streptosporangiaceae bacterium]
MFSIAVAVFLDEAGVKNWRTQAGAAVAAAAVTLLGNFIKEWLADILNTRAKLDEERAKYLVMRNEKLPRIREIADPISIGVHPAPPRLSADHPMEGRDDRVPVYVQRDVDSELRAVLSRSGFIVLVGDATAGKTRTAFEAMQAVLPDYLFIAPSEMEGMPVAVQEAAATRKCVLWLDELQDFLGPDGLTRKAIAELMQGTGHHRVILATMRATEESHLATGDRKAGESLRLSQSVVDQAHRIFVERLFNAAERARVQELAGQDSRLADAIRHADNYGIGEYLACGPQLSAEWQDAWARGNHPRGAALIAAAVDCRRAGFTGPLPRSLVQELHYAYLDQHNGSSLYPETLEEAWDWAIERRESGSAPLRIIDPDRCEVFDYLIDELQRQVGEVPPESTARVALSYAGPDAAGAIALTAWRQGRYELAELAIRKVVDTIGRRSDPNDPDTLAVRNNLAAILYAQGRLGEAETEYRAILQSRGEPSGPDRPEFVAIRNNLAATLHVQGRLDEAEAEYLAILQTRTEQLGADHPETLAVRNNLAVALHGERRFPEAMSEYQAILTARTEVLGADHPDTLITRNNLAVVLENLGRLDAAEAEYRAVLDARTRVLGPHHPHTKISRGNLESLLSKRSVR